MTPNVWIHEILRIVHGLVILHSDTWLIFCVPHILSSETPDSGMLLFVLFFINTVKSIARWTLTVTETERKEKRNKLSRINLEQSYIREDGEIVAWRRWKWSLFNDLADLALIEVLSYLSCTDALCAFTSLNDRWTCLLAELGFFRQVNLSPTYSRQFHQLLQILPLNNIETLVIDRTASPLQLRRWPYLPRLTKLHLQGVREYAQWVMEAPGRYKIDLHLSVCCWA
jgi:hypothetical protein